MIGNTFQPQKVFVHLQLADPSGKIKSQTMNFRVACDPDSSIPHAMTPVISAVTCPLCIATSEYEEIKAEQSYASSADRKAAEHVAAQEKPAETQAEDQPTPPEKTS